MSLIEKTFAAGVTFLLEQSTTLNKYRADIERFEELCAVLRAGSSFHETLEAEMDEVTYHIHPKSLDDYLVIIEALGGMGAHRITIDTSHELVNTEPDAPEFWLHIPSTN